MSRPAGEARAGRLAGGAYAGAYLAFLFAPIVVVALFSFHRSPALTLPFRGFSLRWYESVAESDVFVAALTNSLIVATTATLVTTALGTLMAIALTRLKRRWRQRISTLAFLPAAVPGLFIGLSLLALFSLVSLKLSLATVVAAHVLYTLPFFLLVVRSTVERFDVTLEEAARDLGATTFEVFRRVTFPIIRPGIVGAAILCFALSMDEFVITFFVIGNESTLPVLIWSSMRRTVDPSLNVIATLMLAFSLVSIVAAGLLLRGRRGRRAGEVTG